MFPENVSTTMADPFHEFESIDTWEKQFLIVSETGWINTKNISQVSPATPGIWQTQDSPCEQGWVGIFMLCGSRAIIQVIKPP